MQDSIVDTLGGGTLIHNQFETCAASGDSGKQAQIPIRFGIDDPAIRGRRAAIAGIGTFAFAKGAWAAPLDPAAVLATKAGTHHLMPGGADRYAVAIDNAALELAVAVIRFIQGNDSVDIPFAKELVCGVVVAGAVGDKGVDGKFRIEVPELGDSDDGGNAVMALGVNDTQIQGQIQFLRTVVR